MRISPSPARTIRTADFRTVRAVGYVAGEEGLLPGATGAQQLAIEDACAQRRWQLLRVVTERQPASRPNRRALLQAMGATLPVAEVLVVASIKNIAWSLDEYIELMQTADREGWHLVALDAPVSAGVSNAARAEGVRESWAKGTRDQSRPSVISPAITERILALAGR